MAYSPPSTLAENNQNDTQNDGLKRTGSIETASNIRHHFGYLYVEFRGGYPEGVLNINFSSPKNQRLDPPMEGWMNLYCSSKSPLLRGQDSQTQPGPCSAYKPFLKKRAVFTLAKVYSTPFYHLLGREIGVNEYILTAYFSKPDTSLAHVAVIDKYLRTTWQDRSYPGMPSRDASRTFLKTNRLKLVAVLLQHHRNGCYE